MWQPPHHYRPQRFKLSKTARTALTVVLFPCSAAVSLQCLCREQPQRGGPWRAHKERRATQDKHFPCQNRMTFFFFFLPFFACSFISIIESCGCTAWHASRLNITLYLLDEARAKVPYHAQFLHTRFTSQTPVKQCCLNKKQNYGSPYKNVKPCIYSPL